MTHLSTDTVQNLVDNEGTSSAAPIVEPFDDLLDVTEPATFAEHVAILGGAVLCLIVAGIAAYLIWSLIWN